MYLEIAVPVVTTPIAAFVLARIYRVLRDATFARAKTKLLSETVTSPAGDLRLSAYWRLLSDQHHQARALQDRYHLLVGMATASLFVAFVVFAAEVTLLPKTGFWHGYAAWTDLWALVVSLACALNARGVILRWIRQRTQTELMRQSLFLEEGLGLGGPPSNDLTTRFEQQLDKLAQVVPRTLGEIAPFVRDYWRQKSADIATIVTRGAALDAQTAALYHRLRISRQARWFEDSRARLIFGEEVKSTLLYGFFGLALLSAAAKAILVVLDVHHGVGLEVSAFLFLLSIGASTALVGLFANQNSRSLIHRYGVQLAQIARFAPSPLLGGATPPPLLTVDDVVAFEGVMIEELIDFIEITRRDVIEISPS